MKRARFSAIATIAGLFVLGILSFALSSSSSEPAQASTVTVNISNDFFSNSTSDNCGSPCVTNVSVGDTVHWVWLASATNTHSTTSDSGTSQVWDSDIQGPGFTFDQTFNTPGSYSYHCRVHSSMHGTIVVGGTPTPTSALPTATPTPAALVGDANKDGQVNAIDTALVLQYSAGLIASINPDADANQNGEVNAIDATLVLQYGAGLIGHLPP